LHDIFKKEDPKMQNLGIGKIRGLQQISTPGGKISVLALDHRNNLRNFMNPTSPKSVTDTQMSLFKQDIVSGIRDSATAVLLDPEVGGAQCIASRSLSGKTGLIVTLESTGYLGSTELRFSQVMPGWSVEKARRMGANAVKLLVYFNPKAKNSEKIKELVVKVAEDCETWQIPLFLETLSYSVDPIEQKLHSDKRYEAVIETARQLTIPGVDILKTEFPLDVKVDMDEKKWARACETLSKASNAPWVLLSASVDYDLFLKQVKVACRSGSTGVAAGRAVWKEAINLTGDARKKYIATTVYDRMQKLTELCEKYGRSWIDFYEADSINSQWFSSF
jgi:tagatose 1,6-diphosphate aldolase